MEEDDARAGPPDGHPDRRSRPDDAMRRRRFLASLGAGTAAVTAGCSTVQSLEATAEPVVLPDDVRAAFGATEVRRRALATEVGQSVAGVRLRAEVTNQVAVYALHAERGAVRFGDGRHGRVPSTGADATNDATRYGGGTSGSVDEGRVDALTALATPLTVGVLATPSASLVGQELNPLARDRLASVLEARAGRGFLEGLLDGEPRVVEPLSVVGTAGAGGAGATVERSVGPGAVDDAAGFAGVVDADGDPSLVYGNVVRATRGESGDDAVLGAGVQRRPLPRASAATLQERPVTGDGGWVTPEALATVARQTAAFLPHLVTPASGRRPFGDGRAPDPALGPGEYVSDLADPRPDLAVVLATPGARLDDWVVYREETVADHNPDRDPGEPVVLVAFVSLLDAGWPNWRGADAAALFDEAVARAVKFHAFPRSRLARHLVGVGG